MNRINELPFLVGGSLVAFLVLTAATCTDDPLPPDKPPAEWCKSSDECEGAQTCIGIDTTGWGECGCDIDFNGATCAFDGDCGADQTCELTCTCSGSPDPTDPTVPEGEEDPVDDCTSEMAPRPCFPDIDITNVAVSCDQGTTTVRVTVAGGNPVPDPTGFHGRSAHFTGADVSDDVILSAVASGNGSYSCTLNADGVAQQPLGAGDVCGIAADGASWEFVLSPESAGPGITDVAIEFMGLSPDSEYLEDVAGPFPTQCP